MRFITALLRKLKATTPTRQLTAGELAHLSQTYHKGDYETVIADCDRLLLDKVDNADVYLLRGLARYGLGDVAGAGLDMKRAVEGHD